MSSIISARGLSKLYHLGAPQHRYKMLREAIMEAFRAPFRRHGANQSDPHEIWALRDVSFEVRPGEVIGIIGRNGAGKSTLLKILSQITEPTIGEVDLYGRVGSLLEVGMGFHGELSGRDNIFLSAAILGMRRNEIIGRFDEIVAFSEMERFLDTPVKFYSSGMFMRLAFVVAAHLQPEILIVDEVLAVGDLEFQKKCLGKMEDVAKEGRTVIFVSHNMAAVRTLCRRGIYLDQGRVVFDGDIGDAVTRYVSTVSDAASDTWRRSAPDHGAFQIDNISAKLEGHSLNILIESKSLKRHKPAFLAVDISEPSGTVIMQALPQLEGFIRPEDSPHKIEVKIDLPPLIPGIYRAGVWIGTHNTETLDEVRGCVSFIITESPTPGRTFPHTPDHGFIVPEAEITKYTKKTEQPKIGTGV
ncbi:MAG: ABC transporter ATP-binding protein [Acidobacteria bacterium]|nr:ABC transporter ATP-binding protein [Acidobacteriota bacterium]